MIEHKRGASVTDAQTVLLTAIKDALEGGIVVSLG